MQAFINIALAVIPFLNYIILPGIYIPDIQFINHLLFNIVKYLNSSVKLNASLSQSNTYSNILMNDKPLREIQTYIIHVHNDVVATVLGLQRTHRF